VLVEREDLADPLGPRTTFTAAFEAPALRPRSGAARRGYNVRRVSSACPTCPEACPAPWPSRRRSTAWSCSSPRAPSAGSSAAAVPRSAP